MQKTTLILLFLSIFLLLGCVAETDIGMPENEKGLSKSSMDLDGDNETDITNYIFAPIVLDADGNIIMQRSVSALPSASDITIESVNDLTEENVSQLEILLFQFESEKKNNAETCMGGFGLNAFGASECENPAQCAELCTGPQCKNYTYANELLGNSLYNFLETEKTISNEIAETREAFITIKNADSSEKQRIMRKLSSILDNTLAINSNPLFNPNMLGVCRFEYDSVNIREMLSILGEYERHPVQYTYVVALNFAIAGKVYTELKITDSVPSLLRSGLANISTIPKDSMFNAQTSSVSWPTSAFVIYPKYILTYSFTSTQQLQESLFALWPTPKISMRIVSLGKSPIVAHIVNTSKTIYSFTKTLGYYPALAAVLAFWVILFFMMFMLTKIGISFITASIIRISLKDSLAKALGNANPYWKEYVLASALFFVLGVAMLFAAAPVAEETLIIDNITMHLLQNPLGFVSALFFFLSLHMAYALLEDRFKGLILGRMYYENILDVSQKANEIRFRKLQEKMTELKQKFANAGNMDVSDEKSVYISIPLERAETLLKKTGSESAVKELLEMYLSRIESALVRIDEKTKISKDYWADWSREISEQLAIHESIQFTQLTKIPPEWRIWAVHRFIAENEDEALVVDGQGIKKAEAKSVQPAENILKKLAAKELIFGGVILKKDGIESIASKLGSSTLETILSWKLANYAKTLGQKIFNSEYNTIIIVGKKNAAAFIKTPENDGVIFAPKEKISQAFTELENKLKKF